MPRSVFAEDARQQPYLLREIVLLRRKHILVTNLGNRRSVVVRIADRGPEAWTGRVLDLSRTAAYSLGMIHAGVVPVSYRVVN